MADSDDEGEALVHTDLHTDSTKRRGAWKRVTVYAVGGVLLVVLLVGCAFTGGVFTGMRLASSTATTSSSPPTCPSKLCSTGFDWGSTVNVEGKNTSVADWLDANLKAKNMEDNLRLLRDSTLASLRFIHCRYAFVCVFLCI